MHMARRAEAQHRAQLLIKRCVAIVFLTLALGGASEAAAQTCGNGVVDPGEQCDLGSWNGGPIPEPPDLTYFCCTATCQFAASGSFCAGGTCNATGTCSCGNGVVDPGEECDDGAANRTGGTCCAPYCQLLPPGTPCADDGDLCTADLCLLPVDECIHWMQPSGGCATPTVPGGASIVLQTRHGHNRAHFKWGKGPPVQLADFGNPGSELTRLCIYEFDQPYHPYLLIAGASPSDSTGGAWTQTSTGWKFKSSTGASDGVTGVTLKASRVPSKAKVSVVAQGNLPFTLPLGPGLYSEMVVVQFKTSLGTCWGATFSTATRSTAREFKAKSATPP